MATKSKQKYLKRFKREARRDRKDRKQDTPDEPESNVQLQSETKRSIVVVGLFTLAILTALSLFGWLGGLGGVLNTALIYVFGWIRWGVPLIFAAAGYVVMRPQRYELRVSNYIGLGLFLLSLTGFLHLITYTLEEATKHFSDGKGGGYIGLLLSYPLEKIVGPWGTGVILVAVFLISVLVMFDLSLERLYQGRNVLHRLRDRFRAFRYRLKTNLNPDGTDDADAEDDEPSEAESGTDPEEKPFKARTLDGKGEDPEAPTSSASGQLNMLPKTTAKSKRKVDIPVDLLESSNTKPLSGDIESHKVKIQRTFANFGIEVDMGETKVGPTVTQYTLKPAEGVKLSQITSLSNDLALSLAAHPIRIEAPIPGKSLVGIEVPNEAVAVVKLKDVIASSEFKKRKSKLTIGLGQDVAGRIWLADLDPMPHLLIAGSTGSGKSVSLNSILLSLLYQNSPDELKMILVDPKRVELSVYNGIPHLLTPVINEVDKTINALRWVVAEMDRRYQLLSKTGHRDIHGFNRDNGDQMPYLVVAIDELADLMSVAANEVEAAIIRLAQMARAVGIHLVLATQRPSVDIITGLIKANITSRIAFSVASIVDSRTILDSSGAEKLLGRGDMLYISPQLSKPKRLQGAYVTDQEINRVTAFLKDKAKPDYQEEVTEKMVDQTLRGSFEDMGDDELLGQAKDLVIQSGKASASLLQRRLRVGYARAARLLDILEEQGVIGPGEGAKPREILITDEEEYSEEKHAHLPAEDEDSDTDGEDETDDEPWDDDADDAEGDASEDEHDAEKEKT